MIVRIFQLVFKQYQARLIKDTGFCGNFYKLSSKKAKKNFL